jgi:hypothetical protein
MTISHLHRRLPVALYVAAFSAAAQPLPAARPDPLDAQAAVPATVHESAFARYRRLGEDKPIPWREANDTAARIGGWRAYAREAQRPEPAPSAAAATPERQATPVPQGHGGHRVP